MALAPRGGRPRLPGVLPAGRPRTASSQCLRTGLLGTPLGQADGDALVLSGLLVCALLVLTWASPFWAGLPARFTKWRHESSGTPRSAYPARASPPTPKVKPEVSGQNN